MRLKAENLELAARKSLVLRLLRYQSETGAIGQEELLALEGRIEGAGTREALDAVQAEIEARNAPGPGQAG